MHYLIDLPDDLPQERADGLIAQLERTITADGRFLFIALPQAIEDSQVAAIVCYVRTVIGVSAHGSA
jgi:hypothetical protein